MQLSQWFYQQLQTSTQGFLWAVEQIPQEYLYLIPEPDKWSVARIIYHMLYYDQRYGLPTLRQWTGGPCPVTSTKEEEVAREEASWMNRENDEVQTMVGTFKNVRAEQLALIQQFLGQEWSKERCTIWSSVTLFWVVTKTYQHTLEHTNEILRAYLLWRPPQRKTT